MAKLRRITSNSIYILVEKASVLGVSLALFLLVARYMGQKTLGQYAFAYGLSSSFWIFLDLGLNTSLVREVARGGRPDAYISSVAALKLGLSPPVLLALWAAGFISGMSLPVLLFGVALVLNALGETFNSAFKGFRRMQYSTAVVVCVQVSLLAGCTYVVLRGGDVVGIGWAYILSRLFHLLFAFALYRRHMSGMGRPDRRLARSLMEGSVFHIPASYFILNTFNLGTALVFYVLTEVDAAYFGAASKLCAAVFVLSTSLPEALFPEMASSEAGLEHLVASRRLLLPILPVVLVAAAFPEEVLSLFYGGGYRQAAGTLRVISAFLPVGVVSVLLHYLLIASGRQRAGFSMLCGASAWCLASGFILVPSMGPSGAAVASSSGMAMLLLCLYLYYARKVAGLPMKETLKKASVFVTFCLASAYLVSRQTPYAAAVACLALWPPLIWMLG